MINVAERGFRFESPQLSTLRTFWSSRGRAR
jgi:hypothetical protein